MVDQPRRVCLWHDPPRRIPGRREPGSGTGELRPSLLGQAAVADLFWTQVIRILRIKYVSAPDYTAFRPTQILVNTGANCFLFCNRERLPFFVVHEYSEIQRGLCHLALPKFSQKYVIDRPLSTPWTHNRILEIGTHGLFVDRDLSDVVIEFLLAAFAFKIDRHLVSISVGVSSRQRHDQHFHDGRAIMKYAGSTGSGFYISLYDKE